MVTLASPDSIGEILEIVQLNPHLDDAPYIHEKLIREVLSQYCEIWSNNEAQRQYIVELGIPAEWIHEALVSATS